jgi:hypothetical protein
MSNFIVDGKQETERLKQKIQKQVKPKPFLTKIVTKIF